jgi:hypothetical protein
MAFDYMQADRAAMARVDDLLTPLWQERLPRWFVDLDVVFSTFVIKRPGLDSGMFLHDDRTFVDERRHRAHTLWIPLVDTSPELDNGCLYILPGSHHLMPAASGTGTPDWVRPYEQYLERFLLPLSMRAGEALLYDTKTLHGSTPNRTDVTREAIAVALAPGGADLVHVVADGPERVVHQVDRQFFQDVHPHDIAEHGMPDRYPVVERYVETTTDVDPVAMAAICDPDEVPAAIEPEMGPDGPIIRGIQPEGATDAGPTDEDGTPALRSDDDAPSPTRAAGAAPVRRALGRLRRSLSARG